MRHIDVLIEICFNIKTATTPQWRFRHMIALRNLLNSVDPMEMFLSSEMLLLDLEESLTAEDKQVARQMGYNFQEDLERPV